MAAHYLTRNFQLFFSRLNPSTTFEQTASREYNSIKSLIEDRTGLASPLLPTCFLQGSYRQQTAIYSINDVDIVALCELWHPASGTGQGYGRNEIFDIVASPLLSSAVYGPKVRYTNQSMCIKVGLGIKVEILPVVFKAGNNDPSKEPFRLYRPENTRWEDGFARFHQTHLSLKNSSERAGGNFIPAVKILKHLRSQNSLHAVSFHLECLLYSLSDLLFIGSPADYIPALLNHISTTPAEQWYTQGCMTPCGDRNIFTQEEWSWDSWAKFHQAVCIWAKCAQIANVSPDQNLAIQAWQTLLGDTFFPATVS